MRTISAIQLVAVICALTGLATPARAAGPSVEILILGGGREPPAAEEALKGWRLVADDVAQVLRPAPGYPKIIRSDAVEGLKPGFSIVVVGTCNKPEAGRRLGALRAFFPGAYGRTVTGLAAACPTAGMRVGASAQLDRKPLRLRVVVIEPRQRRDRDAKVVALLFKRQRLLARRTRGIGPLESVGEGWDGGCTVGLRKKRDAIVVLAHNFTNYWTDDPREEWTDRYLFSVDGEAIVEEQRPAKRR